MNSQRRISRHTATPAILQELRLSLSDKFEVIRRVRLTNFVNFVPNEINCVFMFERDTQLIHIRFKVG